MGRSKKYELMSREELLAKLVDADAKLERTKTHLASARNRATQFASTSWTSGMIRKHLSLLLGDLVHEMIDDVDVARETGNMPWHDIRQFHEHFELAYEGAPRALPTDMQEFRSKFLREEVTEYDDAVAALAISEANASQWASEYPERDPKSSPYWVDIVDNRALAFDALIDLVYVALGTAYLHGFNFPEGWRRVHEANMAKVRVENVEQSLAGSGRGSVYDVVKPEGWLAPDHRDLVVPFVVADVIPTRHSEA